MKQILRFSLMSALFLLCGSSYAATDVKFDFDANGTTLFGLSGESDGTVTDGDFTEAKTATIDGVSVTVSAAAADVTNANRIWNKSPKLRMYSGTLTVAAPEGHKITAMTINQGKWNSGNTADKGTLSSEGWSGSESSVVITIAGNTQLKDITVTLDGEGGGEPGDEPGGETNYGTAEAPLTVAAALAIATALDKDASTSEFVYTKGVVTEITTAWSSRYNNVSFNISDDGGTTTLAVFRCNSEAEDYVLAGDEVIIKGKLKNFKGDTPEYDQGCEIVSLKQGEGHNTQIETPTADDIAAFKAMEKGKKVILTLKDAQVIGVGNKYMVVKDATGALNLYDTGLQFTLGQILNGTITGQTNEYKSIKQLSDMSENTLTATDGEITTTEISVADAAAADILSGPYVIKNAVVEQDGSNFYIVDGETKLQLYNQFRYEGMTLEAGTFDIEGIVGNYNNIQFWPNKITAPATGIQNLKTQKTESVIYNLAGQRVEKATKGIYIQNGKKFIVK